MYFFACITDVMICIFLLNFHMFHSIQLPLYSILFYSILLCSILFYSVLFYPILFNRIQLYFISNSILFYYILFYSFLFYSILFYSILVYFVLFDFILFYSILFYSILFYSILFYSILFYSILFYSILFYSRSHKRRFRAYVCQNRSPLPAPSCLKLTDFLAHHKHAQPPVNLRLSKSSYSGVDTWKQRTLSLSPPVEPVQVNFSFGQWFSQQG